MLDSAIGLLPVNFIFFDLFFKVKVFLFNLLDVLALVFQQLFRDGINMVGAQIISGGAVPENEKIVFFRFVNFFNGDFQ